MAFVMRAAALALALVVATGSARAGPVCDALGVIAGSAVAARERGVPVESLQAIMDLRAREHGVTTERRARIRAVIAEAYAHATADLAERRTVERCTSGRL